MSRLVVLSLTLALSLVVSCDKPSAAPPAGGAAGSTGTAPTPASPPATPSPPRAATAPPAPGAATNAALLTEEKLRAFTIYQRTLAGGAEGLMHDAVAAHAKSGADPKKAAGRVLASKGMERLAEAGQRALTKSGLTQMEVGGLTQILTPYYASRMMAVSSAEALAASKAKGKPGMMESFHREQVEKGEKIRAEFGAKYGKEALAVVDRHEKDMVASMNAMVGAAFKKR